MTNIHYGGCLCGQTRYELNGDPEFNVKCYCRDCQQLTGGSHSPQVAFQRKNMTFSGPIAIFERASDSGSDLRFHFCTKCGVCVFKYTTKLPELAFIPAGSLDDPTLYREQHLAYEDSRLGWDH